MLSRERYLVPYLGWNKLHHRYIDIFSISQIGIKILPRTSFWPLRLCHDLQSVLVHKDVGRQFIDKKKGRMRPARKNFFEH